MDRQGSDRHVVLDALRGVAVALAMVDHVKVQFVTDVHVLVPLTRLSTPAFVILFGAMLEVAYLAGVRRGRPAGVAAGRMASRMVTCGLLSGALLAAAVIGGHLTPQGAVTAAAGLDWGRFNEILLIYAALFALVLGLWRPVLRHGAPLILGLAAAGWAARAALAPVLADPGCGASFLLGVGTGYGPALLPGLTFLGAGMACGEVLTGRRGPALPLAILLAAGAVGLSELGDGPAEAARRFLAHRWTNHPGYYAAGILSTAGIAAALAAGLRAPVTAGPVRGLAAVGTQTLFVYGAGNLALNLLPAPVLPTAAGIVAAAGFLAALFGLALAGPAGRDRLALGLPGRLARLRAGWQGAAARGALRALRRGPAGSPPAPAG